MKGGEKMKDEKQMCPCCKVMKGHVFMLLGILALVYGLMNYLQVNLGMPGYETWIIAGVVLLAIAWLKKMYMADKCCK